MAMEIELTPEQGDLIRLGIEQGRYRDSADAIQRAMDLWVDRERNRLELIASLDESADSIEAGEGDTILDSDADIAAYIDGIKQRGRTRLVSS